MKLVGVGVAAETEAGNKVLECRVPTAKTARKSREENFEKQPLGQLIHAAYWGHEKEKDGGVLFFFY